MSVNPTILEGPIGVFDSGVGGLTVLSALVSRFPQTHYIYLGDTARVPYGTKSQRTIEKYAHQATQCLLSQGAKSIVIACNSASAMASQALRAAFPHTPIYDVIEPGVLQTVKQLSTNHVAILGTHSTIANGAYQTGIRKHVPGITLTTLACPLLVSLAEEGWTQGPAVEQVIHRSLRPLVEHPTPPSSIILGCTHFPLLTENIKPIVGKQTTLIDSGKALANSIQINASLNSGTIDVLVTDTAENFTRVAKHFWRNSITWRTIKQIDL